MNQHTSYRDGNKSQVEFTISSWQGSEAESGGRGTRNNLAGKWAPVNWLSGVSAPGHGWWRQLWQYVWQCPVGVNICGNMYRSAVDKESAITYFDKREFQFFIVYGLRERFWFCKVRNLMLANKLKSLKVAKQKKEE